MPRKTPVRTRTSISPTSKSDPCHEFNASRRRLWLDGIKKRAIRELPWDAPAGDRVKLRKAIQLALKDYGPNDSQDEVDDIVQALVDRVCHEVESEQETENRGGRKKQHVELGMACYDLAIEQFPERCIGKRNSALWHSTRGKLRRRFRSMLNDELTGDEPCEGVMERLVEFLADWRVEQDSSLNRHNIVRTLKEWMWPLAAVAATAVAYSPRAQSVIKNVSEKAMEVLQDPLCAVVLEAMSMQNSSPQDEAARPPEKEEPTATAETTAADASAEQAHNPNMEGFERLRQAFAAVMTGEVGAPPQDGRSADSASSHDDENALDRVSVNG